MSQHPVDQLIRNLVRSDRGFTSDDIQAIISRMASASFSAKFQRVPVKYRLTYQGETLGSRADSLTFHLVKRVLGDQQWAVGTRSEEYLRDAQNASRATNARIVVYETDWGGPFAAAIAPTVEVVPQSRLGSNAKPRLFVLYSAHSAIIVTAYMFSSIRLLRLPGDAKWLK